ncbi:hypothetical protein [Clostridium sp.]|uniref:hypothetical protein n=1 Tax=Clostridium sp. TaxID=1506 RepID=UPI00261A8C70|nr:hypothetical protein [Clostridium sp.]
MNEIRYLPKVKCPAIIEYFDISNFIDETSLIIDEIDYTDISYSYICCDNNKNSNSEDCIQCSNLIPNSMIINLESIKTRTLSLCYLTGNITWNSSYNVILKKDSLSIESWFNIVNKSGLNIENASIKCIAGEANLSYSGPILYNKGIKYTNELDLSNNTQDIADYSVYVLENKYDLPNNTLKRIYNFNKSDVLYSKIYEFGYYLNIADIKITFDNTAENNLGIVFPSGSINAYAYYNNNLEFLGGNSISNIRINSSVSFIIGKNFDVSVERKILAYNQYKDYSFKEVNYIITNNSNEPIKASINEPIFAPWQIDYSSDIFERDANGNPIFIFEMDESSVKSIIFTYKYGNKNC